jgi:hypothetical protein
LALWLNIYNDVGFYLKKGDAFMKSTKYVFKAFFAALLIANVAFASSTVEKMYASTAQGLSPEEWSKAFSARVDALAKPGEWGPALAQKAGEVYRGAQEGISSMKDSVASVKDSLDKAAGILAQSFRTGAGLAEAGAGSAQVPELRFYERWAQSAQDAVSSAWAKAKEYPIIAGSLVVLPPIMYGGYRGYKYYKGKGAQDSVNEAQSWYKELKNGGLDLFESEATLNDHFERFADAFTKLSPSQQQEVKLMVEVKRSQLRSKGLDEKNNSLIHQLQQENAALKSQLNELVKQLDLISQRQQQAAVPERRITVGSNPEDYAKMPFLQEQSAVQQPAAVVQPLTEGELEQIYRRRTTSQAGIQGILKDEGLMARLKASSGKTAQEILKKITK